MDTGEKQQLTALLQNNILVSLILLLAYLAVCIVVFGNLYEDYLVNHKFMLTSCTVMQEKELSNNSSGGRSTYEHLFLVQYETNNSQSYRSWTPLNRIHPWTSFFSLMNEFSVGSKIPCWYDPNFPDKVYLQKGYHVMQCLFLLSCTIILLIFSLAIYVKKKGGSLISAKHSPTKSGDYLIRENLFLIEYTYQGNKPLYPEMLPERFLNSPIWYQKVITNRFNLEGKMMFLRVPFYYLVNLIFIPAFLIFLCVLFLSMLWY